MGRISNRNLGVHLLCLCCALSVISLSRLTSAESASAAEALSPPFSGFDPTRLQGINEETAVAVMDGGRRAFLTIDLELQAHLEELLRRFTVPAAGVVAIEPSTGRVLAYVSHSLPNQALGDVASDPAPPAASIFKIVTASALVDAGVSMDERVCYGGGSRQLVAADLQDNPSRDQRCASLADALGRSINSIFAKLADRHLSKERLEQYASAFAFGQRLPFDARMPSSAASIPENRLERARTAAGFWHTHLSPLHGALLAATIANDGKMPWAAMVSRVESKDGRVLYTHRPSVFRDVIPRSTAQTVGMMMQRTVTEGTSKRAFFDSHGRPFLPGISVAGKTGSLSSSNPYRAYSWWVGYAPAKDPKIALGVLVLNGAKWRIKSSYVAREALREYLLR